MQSININSLKVKPLVKNESDQIGKGEINKGSGIRRATTINNAKAVEIQKNNQ